MYKLYTDKSEDFSCEIQIKNASLKGSIARLVVESADGLSFIFNGKLEQDKCIVPIRRLRGLIDENTRGNMFLEIIVEDTYFSPWKSEFIVEEHTSVKVKLDEQKQPTKPSVTVKVSPSKNVIDEKKKLNILVPLKEIIKLCETFNIKKSTLSRKKNDIKQLVNEYFHSNPEFKEYKTVILKGLKNFLK